MENLFFELNTPFTSLPSAAKVVTDTNSIYLSVNSDFFFGGKSLLLLDPKVLGVCRITGLGKMQGKPCEGAGVVVGRAGGMCGLCHSAGKPVMSGAAPGYVVGITPGCGTAPVEREIEILISLPPGNRGAHVGEWCWAGLPCCRKSGSW